MSVGPHANGVLRRAVGTGDAPVVPPNFSFLRRKDSPWPLTWAIRAALSSVGRFGAGSRVVFACLVPRFQPLARTLWSDGGLLVPVKAVVAF
jgi:hypothetical protein